MSSGDAEYTSVAVACIRASHLRMLINYLRFMGCDDYSHQDIIKLEPARIIIDNEAQFVWQNVIMRQLVTAM